MGLLEDALNAAGGLDCWRRLRRFTVHLSIRGALITRNGKRGLLDELVVEGCTHAQSLRLTGLTVRGNCAIYQPERVAIEGLNAGVLQERKNPQAAAIATSRFWR